jgi:hypothetical protein
MSARSSRVIAALALVLGACGGARPPPAQDATSAATGAERERREQRARRPSADEEMPLGEPVAIPGTGVTLRPPRGTERSSYGSTLLHRRRRIQMLVWAAEGDLASHQQFRAGLTADAERVEDEEVQVDGTPATLTVDRMEQSGTGIERVWVLVRRGTRSIAAMGLYAADRADTLRDLVRASLLSIDFDETAPLDPEAALGWRVAGIEGLQLVRASSMNVSYSVDGQAPRNGDGDPALFLTPVPMELGESERAVLCDPILAQLVQIPADVEVQRAAIANGELQGCEVSAIAPAPPEGTRGAPPQLAVYFALLFRGGGAFLVAGTVEQARREPWLTRFRAAARTLEPVPLATP